MAKKDTREIDERMMRRCFALAKKSASQGEYPYGAVITRKGRVLAESTNKVARNRDVTRHAEVVAICAAQKAMKSADLDGCTLYCNVEPCAFCSYAIRECRITRVVFATRSPVMGGASRWNILGDRQLTDAMPEIFAPPPLVVPDFLAAEGDNTLRDSSPLAWAFMHLRGLVGPSNRSPKVDQDIAVPDAHGVTAAINWVMRLLRENIFDKFGRGGARRKRQAR